MNTGGFNLLDKFIARLRLGKVAPYVGRDDVVLDFGCGVQCYLLSCTRNKFKAGYGLDYDIQDRRDGNITLMNYRYQDRLPFEDHFFDKIFMLAVLEHIEEDRVKALLAELTRILKPGGSIVLTTPTPKGKIVLEWLAFQLKVISVDEIRDHKKYYGPPDMEDVARGAGLKLAGCKLFQFGLNGLYVLKNPAYV